MEWNRPSYRDEQFRRRDAAWDGPRSRYEERELSYINAERRMDYRGRGPKGYRRSDERIREDVCERLSVDPELDASDIDVTVAAQEVTLSGTVRDNAELQRLEECVWDVRGVRLVQNNVRVRQRSWTRESRHMWPTEGPADADRGETLISSDRVIGSSFYGIDGRKIGTIESVMLKRNSGHIAYAVLGFGGFLGIGNDRYPVPWQMLHYDERLGGYVADLTKRDIEHAPRFSEREAWNWDSEDTARQIDGYYRERMGARSARTDNAYVSAAEI
jgi:hypothetical protein